MNEMALPQHLRILTVTAHPHDITYTLGTSAHHIERGDSVTVVSLTDGVTTHDEELANEMRKPEDRRRTEVLERPRSEQARRKQEEMKRVCGLFGIDDVRVLGFADNPITVTQETHRTMAEIFYEVRPHIVISHAPFNYPYRNHSSVFNHDHLTTGQVVGQAIRTIAMPDPEREAHAPQCSAGLLSRRGIWLVRHRFVRRYLRPDCEPNQGGGLVRNAGPLHGICTQADRGLCGLSWLVRGHGICGALPASGVSNQRLPDGHGQRPAYITGKQ